MIQRIKVPATKPDDLSLIPEIYIVGGENPLLQIALHLQVHKLHKLIQVKTDGLYMEENGYSHKLV